MFYIFYFFAKMSDYFIFAKKRQKSEIYNRLIRRESYWEYGKLLGVIGNIGEDE